MKKRERERDVWKLHCLTEKQGRKEGKEGEEREKRKESPPSFLSLPLSLICLLACTFRR